MKRLDEAAQEFVALLESQGIAYAVMGGMAVRIHALPRPTFDVDFTIALPRDRLPEFYDRIEALGYTIPEAQRRGWIDAVKGLPVVKFQLLVAEHSIDVDVFLAETPFQQELLGRRQRHEADGWSAWFVTPEDLILLKLLADRPKDRIDVADLLFIQHALDVEYMRYWATRLGVLPALEAALAQAGGPTA
jgi:hypothetical protein